MDDWVGIQVGEFRSGEKIERSSRGVLLVILCGVLLRAVMVFIAQEPPAWKFDRLMGKASGEAHELWALAFNVAHGTGFVRGDSFVADDEPLFALLAAAMFKVIGAETHSNGAMHAVIAMNMLFDLLTALLLYSLAKRRFGARSGVVAAALWMMYPPAIMMMSRFLPDSAFVLLAVLSIELYDRLERTCWSLKYSLALGLCLGLLTLAKSVGLVFAAAYVIYIVIVRYETARRVRIVSAFVMTAVLLCVITPWMLRNARAVDYFALNTRPNLGLSSGPMEPRDLSERGHIAQVARLWSIDLAQVGGDTIFNANGALDPAEIGVVVSFALLMTLPYINLICFGTLGIYLVPHFGTRGLFILLLFLLCVVAMFAGGNPRDHFVAMPLLILSSCALLGKSAWALAPQWRRIALLLAMGMFGGVWLNEVLTLLHL